MDSQTVAGKEPVPSAFDNITDRALWDCTTCGACVYECPVNIEVYDKIIDLRRQLIDIGRVPPAVRTSLEGLQERRNPWAYPPAQRNAWSEGLKLPAPAAGQSPEWVYWIGCAGSFEASAQSISRSMVNILQQANVSFVTLGCEERCTGDPARRMGDEGLFESFRSQNIETLRAHGTRKDRDPLSPLPEHAQERIFRKWPAGVHGGASLPASSHTGGGGEDSAWSRAPERASPSTILATWGGTMGNTTLREPLLKRFREQLC